jgi:hypothetical protein
MNEKSEEKFRLGVFHRKNLIAKIAINPQIIFGSEQKDPTVRFAKSFFQNPNPSNGTFIYKKNRTTKARVSLGESTGDIMDTVSMPGGTESRPAICGKKKPPSVPWNLPYRLEHDKGKE